MTDTDTLAPVIRQDRLDAAVETIRPIGVAMRGLKKNAEAPLELNPIDAVPVLEPEVRRPSMAYEEVNFWAPSRPESVIFDVAKGAIAPVFVKPEPYAVIVLPTATAQVVREMKDNSDLSFTYQMAERGQVLGTGAQHGLTFNRERFQQVQK